jgi:hypothetical protein
LRASYVPWPFASTLKAKYSGTLPFRDLVKASRGTGLESCAGTPQRHEANPKIPTAK